MRTEGSEGSRSSAISSGMGALEAMGDLYSTLSEEAGESWLTESRLSASLSEEVSNPWDT